MATKRTSEVWEWISATLIVVGLLLVIIGLVNTFQWTGGRYDGWKASLSADVESDIIWLSGEIDYNDKQAARRVNKLEDRIETIEEELCIDQGLNNWTKELNGEEPCE